MCFVVSVFFCFVPSSAEEFAHFKKGVECLTADLQTYPLLLVSPLFTFSKKGCVFDDYCKGGSSSLSPSYQRFYLARSINHPPQKVTWGPYFYFIWVLLGLSPRFFF